MQWGWFYDVFDCTLNSVALWTVYSCDADNRRVQHRVPLNVQLHDACPMMYLRCYYTDFWDYRLYESPRVDFTATYTTERSGLWLCL